MFSFLFSSSRQLRQSAKHTLRLGDKIIHYRLDQLSAAERAEIRKEQAQVREQLKKGDDEGKLKLALQNLERALERHGGPYVKRSSLAENVEVMLIAAILAIGVRTFFLQPFKIPTNSMYPTYYGMVADVFQTPEEEPGLLRRGARGLFLGARGIRVDAPATGTIQIPVRASNGQWHFEEAQRRVFLIFPAPAKAHPLVVNGQTVRLTVPADFSSEQALQEALAPEFETYRDWLDYLGNRGQVRSIGQGLFMVDTGVPVQSGQRALSFDILTGDQLFVDRMSYHFVRPQVGRAIVFRTGNVPTIPLDTYYIKRMVGEGGDLLELRDRQLFRNGEVIENGRIWQRINAMEGRYPGYRDGNLLSHENAFRVPEGTFFTLGDNSPNSEDSRSYGEVPISEIVGRPLWIYYPFTRRWGLAR